MGNCNIHCLEYRPCSETIYPILQPKIPGDDRQNPLGVSFMTLSSRASDISITDDTIEFSLEIRSNARSTDFMEFNPDEPWNFFTFEALPVWTGRESWDYKNILDSILTPNPIKIISNSENKIYLNGETVFSFENYGSFLNNGFGVDLMDGAGCSSFKQSLELISPTFNVYFRGKTISHHFNFGVTLVEDLKREVWMVRREFIRRNLCEAAANFFWANNYYSSDIRDYDPYKLLESDGYWQILIIEVVNNPVKIWGSYIHFKLLPTKKAYEIAGPDNVFVEPINFASNAYGEDCVAVAINNCLGCNECLCTDCIGFFIFDFTIDSCGAGDDIFLSTDISGTNTFFYVAGIGDTDPVVAAENYVNAVNTTFGGPDLIVCNIENRVVLGFSESATWNFGPGDPLYAHVSTGSVSYPFGNVCRNDTDYHIDGFAYINFLVNGFRDGMAMSIRPGTPDCDSSPRLTDSLVIPSAVSEIQVAQDFAAWFDPIVKSYDSNSWVCSIANEVRMTLGPTLISALGGCGATVSICTSDELSPPAGFDDIVYLKPNVLECCVTDLDVNCNEIQIECIDMIRDGLNPFTAHSGTVPDYVSGPPMPNSTSFNPEPLPGRNYFVSSYTTGATNTENISIPEMNSTPECSGINPAENLWFNFTALDVTALIRILGSSNFIPVLEVYKRSDMSPVFFDCNSSNSIEHFLNNPARLQRLDIGEEYLIRIYHKYGLPNTGAFDMYFNFDCYAGVDSILNNGKIDEWF